MRRLLAAVTLAAGLAAATPSLAAGGGFSGYYLATFTSPEGPFSHCIQLAQANGTVSGYTISGTWTATDFPNTAGQFVVYNGILHLAGYVGDPGGTDYLTIDGQIKAGKITHATYDYFTPQGAYILAGNLSEMRDPACKTSS